MSETRENFSLDLDFESYEVPPERAQLIREELQTLRAKTWLVELFAWVKDHGADYQPEQGDLIEGAPCRRLSWPPEHALATAELILDSADLEIKLDARKFAVLQLLPKGEEILVSHYASELRPRFDEIEDSLQSELKTFSRAKAEKNRLIQEKLSGMKKP